MQWQDEGIVLGARRQGETHVVLDLLTRNHGRHAGLVPGGRSQKLQPVLQIGNSVQADWRGRLEGHLGVYRVEATQSRAARFLDSALALNALGSLSALLRLLPERDPHPVLYEATLVLLEHLEDDLIGPMLMACFELAFLSEMGFGLELSACAATGATQDLIYVSPKSGRAVSARAGEPYKDKLMSLPAFLRDSASGQGYLPGSGHPGREVVLSGFRLTGFFLERTIFGPRDLTLPDARERMIALL